MHIIETQEELQRIVRDVKQHQKTIGFVPTMGALHQGHLSLIMNAKKHNDYVIVSVFVNPKQFGEGEDFERYPRPREMDIDICMKAGVDLLFMPNAQSFYASQDPFKILAPRIKSRILEGKTRPDHFDGVVEVVLRLLNVSRADRAYFGRKDAQQLVIIQQMVKELFMPVEIIDCPIQRDSQGLALSSRNRYLSEEGYKQALRIPKALEEMSREIMRGEYHAQTLKKKALDVLDGLEVEYIAIVNRELEEIDRIQKEQALILLVVRIDGVRLLDNLWV